MGGTLFLVSTPIGNPDDITFRAIRVLSMADLVVCEEGSVGSTLLSALKITKPLFELNEHTETRAVPELLDELGRGQNLALISDHGTPLLADPGPHLVSRALQNGIRVIPVPGASAVIAALVASGLPAKRFRFVGQLPQKTALRRRALDELNILAETLVLLDAPYRLLILLKSMVEGLGASRQIAVVCNLTMPGERIVRGTLRQVLETFERVPFKGEFVCVVQGSRKADHSKRS